MFTQSIPVSPKVCLVYVARPGTTDDNYIIPEEKKTGRWSSADITPLSEEGEKSAYNIAKIFQNIHFDKAYCSKAERTRQTAEIILDKKIVKIQAEDHFYEMRIGPFEGKEHNEIIAFFKEYTGYPNEASKDTLPKLWALKNGEDPTANECLLDSWHPEIDTFDAFFNVCIKKIIETALQNLGKTILIVPHGTPMKSIIAQAENVSVSKVECKKGSCYAAEIDEDGNISILKNMMHGISF